MNSPGFLQVIEGSVTSQRWVVQPGGCTSPLPVPTAPASRPWGAARTSTGLAN